MKEILSFALGLFILAAMCWIFVRITRRIRRGGGSPETMAALGSMYDLQGRDERRATETIVELKAGKKLEEQESGEGDDEPETDD
jgi:hypothetical protein